MLKVCAVGLAWHNVVDVVPWVSIKTLVQPQLVNVVPNKSGGPAEDKEGVQDAHLEIPVSFFARKLTRLTQKIHKCHGDGSVDVQYEIRPENYSTVSDSTIP